MVLGIATGLMGLGLALPTGLAFGYGYGYGVRQGYSAFKPPSRGIQELKASPDPIQGSLGMGLQTAEERTRKPVQTPMMSMQTPSRVQPNIPTETNKKLSIKEQLEKKHGTLESYKQKTYVYSKSGRKRISRQTKRKMTRSQYKQWYNDVGHSAARYR